MLKLLFYLLCLKTLSEAFVEKNVCSERNTLLAIKQPIYNFSVHFLDKVTIETAGHFIYSPISTWLQLVSLAEGAKENTLNEIWEVTGLKGYKKKICYRRKLKEILNKMEETTISDTKRSSIMIVDKFFKVKNSFIKEIEALNNVHVILLNFDNPEQSAQIANDIIEENVNGNLEAVVLPEDFDKRVILMTDVAYFKTAWKYPFNRAYTKQTPFFFNSGVKMGTVNMMNQIGNFKLIAIPFINANVLELPCLDERISMLVYLPIKDNILDFYYNLKETSLTGVLNILKTAELKTVNVSLPKFDIETEVTNVVELLHDMGIESAFYPETAKLSGISDSGTVHVSLMTQTVSIEVTETHVIAQSGPESSMKIDESKILELNANKPFAFMLVDKITELILFAGMYSNPNQSII